MPVGGVSLSSTHCRMLMGRKGLKLSKPSACKAVRREDVRSLVEDDVDCPNTAFMSEALLCRDMELEDWDTG